MKLVVAFALVIATPAVAFAIGGSMDPAFQPNAVLISKEAGMAPASGGTNFHVPSTAAPISITSIDVVGCPGVTVTPNSFNIGSGGGDQPLMLTCPASMAFGIDRCAIQAKTGTTVVADMTLICATHGNQNFGKSAAGLSWTNVMVNGTSATDSVMFSTAGAISGIAVEIVDHDNHFKVDAPCNPPDVSGCDLNIGIAPPATITVEARCTPKSQGPHDRQMIVVEKGAGLISMPNVMLHCETAMGGGTQDIFIDPLVISKTAAMGEMVEGTFRISNTSAMDTLTVTGINISSTPDWGLSFDGSCGTGGCMLGPGMFTDVTAEFHPTVIGTNLDATVTVTSDDPDVAEQTLMVQLTGTGTGQRDIFVDPIMIMRSAPVGQMVSGTFTISNTSPGGTLTVHSIDLPSNPHWSLTFDANCSAAGCTLGPMEQTTVTAEFLPTTTGTMLNATVTIASNDPDEPTLSVQLVGEGTAGSMLSANGSFDVGMIRVGRSGTDTVTVSLVGPEPITLTALEFVNGLPGGSASWSSPTVSTSVDITVTVVPPNPVNPIADSLRIRGLINNEVTRPTMITVPITGSAYTAIAEVLPSINAGTFCAGQAQYPPIAVTLKSTGTGAFSIEAKPTLAKGASSPFSIGYTAPIESQYPKLLAPQETATLAIALRPGAVGVYTDTLDWQTDLDVAPTTMIRAELVADGGAISPMAIDFMSQPVRLPSAPRTITLQNCGDTALALSGLAIDNDEFETTSTLPAQLAPLETAVLDVDFTPRTVGIRMAKLRVASSRGSLEVDLTGTGVGSTTGGGEPESLYACSCSSDDPHGAIVIVVAFSGLLIPRRTRRRYAWSRS